MLRGRSRVHGRITSICVAIEGFVLYAGGDYALHLDIVLLVQVMAYVMSDMFVIYIVGHWTCALESGPLIGAPPSRAWTRRRLRTLMLQLKGCLPERWEFVYMRLYKL